MPHLGWIAARAPNRVNRAHGPTKENQQNLSIFWIFPAHAKNWPGGPQMGRGRLFPAKKNLAGILILRIFIISLGSQISGLGPPMWAPRGPTHFGPHVGPPTWAPRGPTHLGPPTLDPHAYSWHGSYLCTICAQAFVFVPYSTRAPRTRNQGPNS